jgi:hypothetical protein
MFGIVKYKVDTKTKDYVYLKQTGISVRLNNLHSDGYRTRSA